MNEPCRFSHAIGGFLREPMARCPQRRQLHMLISVATSWSRLSERCTNLAAMIYHFTVEATSDEFFPQWASGNQVIDIFGRKALLGGPLGFCFIDGNHTEEFAQRDFENCDEYLVSGGLLLFDDSGDEYNWEVKRVVLRIKEGERYEVVAKNPNYLFRKK
jgi:methyltransferase family protein